MEDETERRIRTHCDAGEYGAGATLVVERYGPDILAFLISRLRNRGDADEVFGSFMEKLWVGLPGFEWRCGIRGWCYMLARNAANDYKTATHNRADRHTALSQHPSLGQLADRIRTQTHAHMRTQNRSRVRELRESLSADDQMLLILRVDQGMAWRDLAAAMTEPGQSLQDEELDQQAARLRKRFERAKDRLRQLAQEAGLLSGPC